MSKKIKEHELKNIEDIFKVVNSENFERFFSDLYLFVAQVGEVKRMYPEIEVTGMLWKDDGVNEITGVENNGVRINFKSTKPNNSEKKYFGKTLNEWKKYSKKDERIGIRTEKYIIVLESIINHHQLN